MGLFNESKLLILKELFLCEEEICGCNLVAKLDLPKNLVSYHIKMLREMGIVEEQKCGKSKHYRIVRNELERIEKILKITEVIK